ncbi:hypothetical protein PtB15_4B851 [Puccinia triticina]|nr:hypothetical protein PtB15_4B851 [Puccinia triticina]
MTTMATCPRTRPTHICEWLALGLQDSQTPGYLFLNEVPPLRIKKTTLANHPPPLHSPKQKGKAPTHSRATSHHRRADDQQQHSDRAQRAIESNPAEFGIGSAEQDLKAPIDIFKSPQHAWYFVRRLVGLELRWEAARAWKLTNLNSNSVDTPPCKESSNHHSRVRSNDDQSSYSWDSSSGETTVAAENLPILTYLIQNFLLALPIIWDTVSVIPNVPHSSHLNPQAPANHTSVAVYWTAGVLSILRRLHQSNLISSFAPKLPAGGHGQRARRVVFGDWALRAAVAHRRCHTLLSAPPPPSSDRLIVHVVSPSALTTTPAAPLPSTNGPWCQLPNPPPSGPKDPRTALTEGAPTEPLSYP